MIMLTGYVYPEKGARFGTRTIYINPNQICYMSGHSMVAERYESGIYSPEKVDVTSIAFAVAYEEGQATIEVMESPGLILSSIHLWKLDQVRSYGALDNGK
jgi:hypothetical protein